MPLLQPRALLPVALAATPAYSPDHARTSAMRISGRGGVRNRQQAAFGASACDTDFFYLELTLGLFQEDILTR